MSYKTQIMNAALKQRELFRAQTIRPFTSILFNVRPPHGVRLFYGGRDGFNRGMNMERHFDVIIANTWRWRDVIPPRFSPSRLS